MDFGPMLSLGPQIRELWKSVKKARGWKHPRAPTIRLHFQDARTIPAVLTFLQAEIGRVALAPPEKEWEELEEIVLRPRRGKAPGQGRRGGRPGPALRMRLSFVFCIYFLCSFPCRISSGGIGRKETGKAYCDGRASCSFTEEGWTGVGYGGKM